MLRNTGVRESNSQARMDRDSFELSPRRTKNSRTNSFQVGETCIIPVPQSELDQSKVELVELDELSWSDSDKGYRAKHELINQEKWREQYLAVTESERDISAGESSEETTGEGERREKENCQDGYWEQQKYRQRDRGEMDRSRQKKMAGRPIQVCNGGRESVYPSARSSGSIHDQFESGDPGMRIRGRIHSKWGRLVSSPSHSLSWISPRSSVSWTDQTNKACATCRLDCLGRIKTLLWGYRAKHELINQGKWREQYLAVTESERDISAGESSEETTGEGERREKENCQDDYWEQNTDKETEEKWIGADRKRGLEGRSESVMAGASLSALLRGVLVHFMTSSSLEIQGCGTYSRWCLSRSQGNGLSALSVQIEAVY
ncbi:hypothetical protein F2Q70_00001198 [Brassica cretica]|uniref:Uncharacterized protein n=1 Tax=Brassica cretica TaxID=69181 RepID=A0A8S9IY03_BRACR|nr:hypothetical protein F2Q70_00001198 [Brassica cretica]